MGYKIRITLSLKTSKDEDDIVYEFREKFKKDFIFDMDYLQQFLDEGNEDLNPFYNYFKNTLCCEEEIFTVYNDKPRSKNLNHFVFELEFPIKELRNDLIVVNGKRYFESSVDLKFKQKQYFTVNLGKLTMNLYLAKYVKFNGTRKKEKEAIQQSGDEVSVKENHFYQKKCLSDSEEEHPLIYNHNNVLSSLSFGDYCKKLEQRDIDKREKKLMNSLPGSLEDSLNQCNVCFD